MTKEIVYTDNYALILSDEEVKENQYCLSKLYCVVLFGKNYSKSLYTKIIAHLPLSDAPILEGVPLLPPLPQGDDVEALAKYQFRKSEYEIELREEAFVLGYNKAKEKYKYTEEDIENAFNSGRGYGNPEHTKDFNSFIQSLQQQSRPIHFECEMDYDCCGRYVDCKGCDATAEMINLRIKTTNLQGKEELVGKYLTKNFITMKKEATISLETARAMYEQGGAAKQFALDNFTEQELTTPSYPKTWGECYRGGDKWWVDAGAIVSCGKLRDYQQNQNLHIPYAEMLEILRWN